MTAARRGGRQRIPRPPTARPGARPPWARRPPAVIDLSLVRQVLDAAGPPQRPELVFAHSRPAAVLVPLFDEDGQARVVLTRRTTSLPSHKGEVAFPGGKVHDGEGLLDAALRETHEEVGLRESDVEIIGELDHLATVASRFVLAPFVGALRSRPVLRPNPAEVDRAFDVALVDLLSEDVFREERWDMPHFDDRPVHFFELDDDTVWGATARILHQLLVLLTA